MDKITPANYEPLADIGFSQTLVRVGHVNNVIDALNSLSGDIKTAVRIATTANINLATTGLTAIDGVTPLVGDRILVKNQSTPSQNGIYIASAGAWGRSSDANTNGQILSGMSVFVEAGSQADTIWSVFTPDPIIIGTTSITFGETGIDTSLLVHKAGTETITGNKSFTGVVDLTASSSSFLRSVSNTITAGTTQTNAGATLMISAITRVSVSSTAQNGVRLPAAIAGDVRKVGNSATLAIAVYATVGDVINNLAVASSTDTPNTVGASVISIPPGGFLEFICTLTGTWRVVLVEGQIFTKEIVLTNAQILTLNGTPIQAVAASGVTKQAIIPIKATMAYTFSTAAYATNTELDLIHSGSTVAILKTNINQAGSTFAVFADNATVTPSAGNNIIANADLNLFVPAGNPTGGNAGSSIKVTISFMYMTILQ